jgi:hypothetical protein
MTITVFTRNGSRSRANDIWRNIESNIRLFADDCILYRRIIDSSDIEKLQTDLSRLGEWAVENEMKINPDKSKAVSSIELGEG